MLPATGADRVCVFPAPQEGFNRFVTSRHLIKAVPAPWLPIPGRAYKSAPQ